MVFVHEPGVIEALYIDYNKVTVIVPLTGSVDNTSPVLFGKSDGAVAANHFNGSIDEVAIYNRALNQNEIQALYLVPEPTTISLALVAGMTLLALRKTPKNKI